jgi:hypothetical protein
MPLRVMLATMDSAELALWDAFDQIEPIGERRADLRAGIIAANIAAGQRAGAHKPGDFVPDYWIEPEVAAKEKATASVMALVMAAGAEAEAMQRRGQ